MGWPRSRSGSRPHEVAVLKVGEGGVAQTGQQWDPQEGAFLVGCRPQESVSRARNCKISNQPSNHTHNHLETSERGEEHRPPLP